MTRKSPAFSFYPDSWIGGTALMSSDEKAAYIDLLCVAWLHGGLTREQAHTFCRSATSESIDSVISSKFIELNDGVFVNNRLEEERKKQVSRSENGKKGGRGKKAKRKLNESKRQSQIKHSDSVSVSVSTTGSVTEDNHPSDGLSATDESDCGLDAFPTRDGHWSVPKEKFDQWCETFENKDWVVNQLRLARQWLLDNPSRKKTKNGMSRYIGSWLSRENNRRGTGKSKTTESRVATVDDMKNYNPNGVYE